MAGTNYKVKLFVATSPKEEQRTGKAANHIDTFGVTAVKPDAARPAARAWLEARGWRVRSVNFTPENGVLLAYVFPKETKPS